MPGPRDASADSSDATTDVGESDASEDASDGGEGDDASVDAVPDTFDAGPLTCPGPGGDRNDPIVLYTFEAPDVAAMITDRAPAAPDVPLTDNIGTFSVDTAAGGSIVLRGGQVAATLEASDALTTEVVAAGSFAVEVWFTEDDVLEEEEPERIVTLSLDSTERSFTVGQEDADLVGRFRTTTTDAQGIDCDDPTVGDARPPQAELFVPDVMDGTSAKHVVYSFDAAEGRPRMYLDGVEVGDPSPCRVGTIDWPTGYRLALGDEFDAVRTWEGVIYRVAIYARALSPAEVSCWHGAGRDADVFR